MRIVSRHKFVLACNMTAYELAFHGVAVIYNAFVKWCLPFAANMDDVTISFVFK